MSRPSCWLGKVKERCKLSLINKQKVSLVWVSMKAMLGERLVGQQVCIFTTIITLKMNSTQIRLCLGCIRLTSWFHQVLAITK